jgi:hypothetical protein
MRTLILIALVCGAADAQKISDLDLARMLSNSNTRQSAIEEILASRSSKVPLLLSWSRRPPAHMDPISTWELDVGLIDAFGELKSREAIPFLIKNISRQEDLIEAPNLLSMKTTEAIESRVPAVAALVKIGPDALPALYDSYWATTMPNDRLAIIVVVSRIASSMKDPSEPNGFPQTCNRPSECGTFSAEEGLKHLKVPGESK